MRLRRLGARHFLAQPIVDIFAGGLLASFAMVRLYSAIARLAGGPSTPLLGHGGSGCDLDTGTEGISAELWSSWPSRRSFTCRSRCLPRRGPTTVPARSTG